MISIKKDAEDEIGNVCERRILKIKMERSMFRVCLISEGIDPLRLLE